MGGIGMGANGTGNMAMMAQQTMSQPNPSKVMMGSQQQQYGMGGQQGMMQGNLGMVGNAQGGMMPGNMGMMGGQVQMQQQPLNMMGRSTVGTGVGNIGGQSGQSQFR